jgi:sodium-dependent dicarboxylate transporter 2/3/5
VTQQDAIDSATINPLGLLAGVVGFLLMRWGFHPEALSTEAHAVAAIGTLMAVWWATEAIPLAATALLPIVLFPVMGVASISETTAPYANPTIYLFLGGFIVALAVEGSGLHRRAALRICTSLGSTGQGLVGGFMLGAAALSMWISNTSTTLMLFPIALSIAAVVAETSQHIDAQQKRNFSIALLLGLAYGASIGGAATLVGTPTNVFMVGFMKSELDIEVAFSDWLMLGLPVTVLLLPAGWLLLTRGIFKVHFRATPETQQILQTQYQALGSMGVAERRTLYLFIALILGWVLRKPLSDAFDITGLSDAGVAITAALAAFLIPSGEGRRALVTWSETARLPWGILLLFGGGLTLAAALSSTGLTLWLGESLAPLGAGGGIVLVIILTALVIFLTELTSNVATTATLLPVVTAVGASLDIPPMLLAAPVTLAASCAFMMPVATPPNAIVYASGYIQIKDMMRAGLFLNLIALVILVSLAALLTPIIFQ